MTIHSLYRVAAAGAVLAVAALTVQWVGGATASDAPGLGGADRRLTYISTDKPIYRPTEKVYIRGIVLQADNHTPAPAATPIQSLVQILGPKGDMVLSSYTTAQDSVLGFAWDIPAEQPGGEYTVKIRPADGSAPAERKFDIRAYRAPRLRSQIVFVRDGYGPGDTAAASLHVERAEGGLPVGAKVTAIARVDGLEAFRGDTKVDAAGNCSVNFKLPAQITRGEGTLALVVEDGGAVETVSKTIPILLQTIDLGLYPEGGDLIAGLPTRVYLEARTPAQKPADIAGIVVDSAGKTVANFRTAHEGRGRLDLTPRKGEQYTLRINEPAGIKTTFPLPVVKEEGAVITSQQDVTARGQDVRLTITASAPGDFILTLAKREVNLAQTPITLQAGQPTEVKLTVPAGADGVLVATLWSGGGALDHPLAERLVFRQPAHSIHIQLRPDQSTRVPGDKASINIVTTDDTGKPISAMVGLTVTDDSILEMIEKREQAPRLPVMVLLESDVRELADAQVYLDSANPKAPQAVDLLLGTQGWRRFALLDPTKFVTDQGDPARRVLALRTPALRSSGEEWGMRNEDDREGLQVKHAAMFEQLDKAIRPTAAAPGMPGKEGLNRDADVKNLAGAKREVQAMKEPQAQEAQAALKPMAVGGAAGPAPIIAGKALAAGDRIKARFAQERLAAPIIRVYAHDLRPNRLPGDRVDFTETLYWNAGIKTDDSGKATVSFALSDAVTTFRVNADAFDSTGALGTSSSTLASVQPFYLEPKLPLEVTSGDTIRLPVALVNGTTTDLSNVTLSATAAKGITIATPDAFTLKASARQRQIIDLAVNSAVGPSDFILTATGTPAPQDAANPAAGYSDKVTRKLLVKPRGFPIEIAYGGLIGPDNAAKHSLTIPAKMIPGSLSAKLIVYPTPLANLTQALERLMQEPNGCFEQTSSTNYPLVMAQQYFITHTGVAPETIQRSRDLLDKGYKRLLSFECKNKGYEWFGSDPAHEALSAYGLMEFTDMAQVQTVDPAMLESTRAWVLKTRDGKGGFKRERPAMHTWISDPDCSNSYILWTLMESGEKSLTPEVAALKAAAEKSANSYVLALAANDLFLAGDTAGAKTLMDRLVQKQNAQGFIDGATTSIVGSGGEALQIETTALTILAWLRDPAYAGAVEKSMQWLSESCKAGRFSSTQATVLALRAIVQYDKSRAHPKAPGSLQVYVDGHPMGGLVQFTADTQGAIALPEIAEMLEPGTHALELKMTGGSSMPYSVAASFTATEPASSDSCKLAITTTLRNTKLAEGGITEAAVTITNRTAEAIPTPIAIIGLPGGLEVRHDQLKELVKSGKIAAYEVLGREVVLYWRDLAPKQKVELPLSLIAAVPGTYTGPASRTYLYYTDEFKQWSSPLTVTITPAAQGEGPTAPLGPPSKEIVPLKIRTR